MDPPRCHPRARGLVTLGWSLPPQYPHLRRRRLDSAVRRASSSVTVSQAVTRREKKQVRPVSPPLHWGREGGNLGAPGSG